MKVCCIDPGANSFLEAFVIYEIAPGWDLKDEMVEIITNGNGICRYKSNRFVEVPEIKMKDGWTEMAFGDDVVYTDDLVYPIDCAKIFHNYGMIERDGVAKAPAEPATPSVVPERTVLPAFPGIIAWR